MNAFEPDEGLDDGMQDGDEEFEKQIEEVRESRRTSKRIIFALFWIAVIAVLGLVIGAWLLVQSWAETQRERETTASVQEQKQEIAEEAQRALCGTEDREIYDRDLCAKWTELAREPAQIEMVEVDRSEIIAAFREYCDDGNCRGANGRTPTAEDVAAAFSRFCANGACQGAPGEPGADAPAPLNGVDGQDGADGQDGQNATPEMVLEAVTAYCAEGACVGPPGADGQPGPPPSAEAIRAAVEAFCANGACVGPQGPAGPEGPAGLAGPQGAPGSPGRGITSIQCQQEPEYAWIITWTDGTSEAIPGPCRAAPIIPALPPVDD